MLVDPAGGVDFSNEWPQQPVAIRIVQLGVGVLFLGTAIILVLGYLFEEEQSSSVFPLIAALLALYLFVECQISLRRAVVFAILSPVFLASILHFYLSYVMPAAAAQYDSWVLDRFAYYFISQSEQLSEAMLLVVLAAFCMWRGYYAGLPIAGALQGCLLRVRSLRQDLRPALLPVLGLQVVYFGLIAFAIERGVFGISSTVADRQANAALLDVLRSGMMGGSLALFLLLVFVFRRRAEGKAEATLTAICVALIFLNVLTGAMSGFKSQIVMPFVMLAFAKFVAVQRLSFGYLFAAGLALVLAYQVIEPYRAYLHSNYMSGRSDIGSLVEALQKSQEQKGLVSPSSIPLASQIAARFDLTGMSAVGVAFVNGNGHVGSKSGEFAESLYLSPVLAFVPRALWPGKPSYSSGVWFNRTVLGKTEDKTTSVGMGPVTWLYFMGGTLGVVIGFFSLGVVQALLFDGVARAGAGGLIVFLSAMMTLVMIPTDVGPAFTGMLRLLPLAFVAQFVLLQPNRTAHWA